MNVGTCGNGHIGATAGGRIGGGGRRTAALPARSAIRHSNGHILTGKGSPGAQEVFYGNCLTVRAVGAGKNIGPIRTGGSVIDPGILIGSVFTVACGLTAKAGQPAFGIDQRLALTAPVAAELLIFTMIVGFGV